MSLFLSTLVVGFLMMPLATAQASLPTLTIAAAADLSGLESELASSFHGSGVRFVTEASAVLSQQIENGAPYDVFMSANAAYIDKLASNRKIVPESVVVYAHGELGMLAKKPSQVNNLKDLARPEVRFVAIANPKLAPYGAAAQEALQKAGLWAALQPKIVYGENVRQTLQLFDSGNADAVITAGSLLVGRQAKAVPQGLYRPIVQKAGIVAASPNRKLAQEFVQFLTSAEGQAIFAKFGFGPPK